MQKYALFFVILSLFATCTSTLPPMVGGNHVRELAIEYFNELDNNTLRASDLKGIESLDTTRAYVDLYSTLQAPFDNTRFLVFRCRRMTPFLFECFYVCDSVPGRLQFAPRKPGELLPDTVNCQLNQLLRKEGSIDRDKFIRLTNFLLALTDLSGENQAQIIENWEDINAEDGFSVPDSVKRMIVPAKVQATGQGFEQKVYVTMPAGKLLYELTIECVNNILKLKSRYLGAFGQPWIIL